MSLERLLLLLLLVAGASPLSAQARRLHWRAIAVDARLDSAGRLHVQERQSIVLSGDWNGAQRRFSPRSGQRLTLGSLTRIDAAGTRHPLSEGDLADVDEYGWVDGSTLRWRSRAPSDPPFDNTELVYELTFTYDNILQPDDGDAYVLDHNFAFANRDDVIEEFTLRLELDPVWSAPPDFSGNYRAGPLMPGEGYVVTVPLRFLGAGRPAGVDFGAPPLARYALAAALILVTIVLALRLHRREQALGRFTPLRPPAAIDAAWLEENVFNHLPEVVGAAWDDTTGAAEVAAVLARLTQERKLESRVEPGKGFFRQPVLHLELRTSRDQLADHERRLVDALFGTDDVTSTERVRERYKKTGFDPASKIRKPIDRLVKTMARGSRAPSKPRLAPTLLLFGLGLALMIIGVVHRPADAPIFGIGVVASLALYVLTVVQAMLCRNRVDNVRLHALRFLIPLGILVGGLALLLLRGEPRIGVFMAAGLTAFVLAFVNSVLNQAGARQSPAMIARRRDLAAARAYFKAELARPMPRLRDEWFPYLIAFGLGGQMDRWFRAFGGTDSSGHVVTTVGGGSSGSSSGPSWTGFGGGGGFAGGGSSGAWAAAAGTMAAGVAAPSSSGSGGGGGGGGGGSSGGGGGGGW